jgi:hypothetical protein
MPSIIEQILKDRGSVYGDFGDNAAMAQDLKGLIKKWQPTKYAMSIEQAEALDMISTKLSRIVTGDPSYPDNWDDIAGYATLIANRLRGNNDSITKTPE